MDLDVKLLAEDGGCRRCEVSDVGGDKGWVFFAFLPSTQFYRYVKSHG